MSLVVLAGALATVTASPTTALSIAALPGVAASSNAVIRYDQAFFVEMRPNTAFDMIQRLPGFAFDAGPQVRGFAGAAGNVLIDGDRPTSKEDDLQSILQRIPASQVDHVDLIRGGTPGIDMHGRTVLANVIRKTDSGLSGVVAVASNVYPDGRVAPGARLQLTRKSGDHVLELSFLPSWFVDDGAGDGNRVRTDPAGNVLISSHLNDNAGGVQLNGTGGYETPLWGGKFRVNLLGFYQRYFENADDKLLTPVGLETLRYRQYKTKGELGLHFEKRLTPKLSLEALAIQKVQRQSFPSLFSASETPETDDFNETDTSGETIARAVVRYRQSDKLSAEVSGEGAFNIQSSDSRFALNGADVPLPAAHTTITEKRGEAAASTTWRPIKTLTLEAGIRAELSQIASTGDVVLTKTLFFPKPRALVTWSPDQDDQLRFRVEREVGQLNFSDFASASALGNGASTLRAGNPNLNPPDAWVFEAAYERRFKGAVFVVTFRHQEIADVEDRIPLSGASGVFDAPGNIGSARENDVLANLTIPLDHLGIKGGQLKAQGNG